VVDGVRVRLDRRLKPGNRFSPRSQLVDDPTQARRDLILGQFAQLGEGDAAKVDEIGVHGHILGTGRKSIPEHGTIVVLGWSHEAHQPTFA
jgi:hypothetical protein